MICHEHLRAAGNSAKRDQGWESLGVLMWVPGPKTLGHSPVKVGGTLSYGSYIILIVAELKDASYVPAVDTSTPHVLTHSVLKTIL